MRMICAAFSKRYVGTIIPTVDFPTFNGHQIVHQARRALALNSFRVGGTEMRSLYSTLRAMR